MFIRLDRSQIRFMYVYLNNHRAQLVLLLLFILGSIALQIYSPLYIQQFLDRARAGEETSGLLRIAFLFLGLTVLRQIVVIVLQFITSDVTWKITNKIRLDVTRQCLNYDMSFHNRHTPGEMVERIDGDVGKLNNFMSVFALKVISNNLLIVTVVIIIFTINVSMGIVVTLSCVLGLYVLSRMGRFGSKTIRNYLSESADTIGFLDERITGREDIRAFNAVSYTLYSYYTRLKRLFRTRKQTGLRIATVLNIGEMVLAIIMAVTLLSLGIIHLQSADLSIGTLFLIYYYMTILLIPLKSMVAEVSELQYVHAALLRLNELLSYSSNVKTTGCARIEDTALEIRFDNVSFHYGDEEHKALRNISFQLPANTTLGLLGKTGSGKSTLARLLCRMCDPQEGSITINGSDHMEFELDSLQESMGIVSQNIELFEGTLRDNITMYKDHITDDQIMRILDRLALQEWISGIPEGLDKRIEQGGRNLSGGEAQLIAFTRVFLRNPQILILDEATSRIDPATERRLDKAMAVLMKNRTCIIIAHRLSTIRKTDYTLVLQEGRVLEFGETRALEQDPESSYSSMIGEGEAELHARSLDRS
ncbi:ABC transporter ATP-binding protein [Paenibacillus spongiae]|uniref:ABC transporter ATP-binding protein/permease n=1 Tax=Paenibacillus spongiae TaxID=2909671 RepID=A0ABY5SJK2_9BACL|nr:ABC transporter ATP-binding protein [Paenibacillus spongiae]UVI32877.1 ABC transporter ATP-binding protein/permease [Paenibacillus spongiae]